MFRRAVGERMLLYSFPVILLTTLSYTGHLENYYLYHPVREITVTPADYGVPFQAGDGIRLHGWYVKPPGPDRPVLLWAHGNAGNLFHRAHNIAAIHKEMRAGVFLFDYRGFDRSEGKPWESGLYDDARAAYAWLRRQVPPERIFVFGRSLGAAVAVRIVSEGVAARGLILESPFETLLAIGKELFPFLPVSRFPEVRQRPLPSTGEDTRVHPSRRRRRTHPYRSRPAAVCAGQSAQALSRHSAVGPQRHLARRRQAVLGRVALVPGEPRTGVLNSEGPPVKCYRWSPWIV